MFRAKLNTVSVAVKRLHIGRNNTMDFDSNKFMNSMIDIRQEVSIHGKFLEPSDINFVR